FQEDFRDRGFSGESGRARKDKSISPGGRKILQRKCCGAPVGELRDRLRARLRLSTRAVRPLWLDLRRGWRWRERRRRGHAPNKFRPAATRVLRPPTAARARSVIRRAAWNRVPDRARDCR